MSIDPHATRDVPLCRNDFVLARRLRLGTAGTLLGKGVFPTRVKMVRRASPGPADSSGFPHTQPGSGREHTGLAEMYSFRQGARGL